MIPLLLLLCLPALAWEPSAAKLPDRQKDLRAAFEGKEDPVVLKDKYKRARQKRPSWADKTSWTEPSNDGKTLYYGVGLASKIKSRHLLMTVAQDRARANLVKQRYGVQAEETRGPDGSVTRATHSQGQTSAEPVDWYEDKKEKTLYALVVELVD